MERIDGENEIEGTTNRVASVTLESDSLSEAPLSARSKRRKKSYRKERPCSIYMDIDAKTVEKPPASVPQISTFNMGKLSFS